FDRYVGIQLLQAFRVLPMRGGTPAGQQSGGSQQECSSADRAHAPNLRCARHEPRNKVAIRSGSVDARPARQEKRVDVAIAGSAESFAKDLYSTCSPCCPAGT